MVPLNASQPVITDPEGLSLSQLRPPAFVERRSNVNVVKTQPRIPGAAAQPLPYLFTSSSCPPLPPCFPTHQPSAASPNSTPRGLDKQNVNQKFVFIFPHRCTCTSGCAKRDNLHSIRCIVAARTTPPKPINRANEQSELSLKPTSSTSRGRISTAPRVNLTPARRDAETFFQKHLVIWSLCKESGGEMHYAKKEFLPAGSV